MKPTKTQETEIWQVYNTWLTAYLNADVKTYDAYFDDDYHFIGSTNNEEFLNRNDTTKFFERTGDQFAGITDLKNEIKILEAFDTSIFLTHFFDAWFLNDKQWTYYGRFRFSSVMQKKNEGWRFIYQHFSMPDSKSDEGETIGFDKVNAENIELKEAIKRRTIELESKNRELEVEAALERVRASTMAMQASEDLARVASVMFDQMKQLGGDLFAFGIVLCDKDKDTVEQWHNLGNEGMISPFSVPVDLDYIHRYRYDQWKAGEELFSIEIPENYIAEHFKLMFDLPSVKATMDEVAAQGIEVEVPEWEIDYGASFKHGYLLVSSRKPFKEDHIFPRFANVFEQAYTRFLDLQKAEAQAREAQIEAAVERVRAQSMAMHHPDDLDKVNKELLSQLNKLEIPGLTGVSFYLIDQDEIVTVWDLSSPGNMTNPNSYSLRYDSKKNPVLGEFVEILKSTNEDYFILDYPKEKLLQAIEEFKGIDLEVANMFVNALESGALQHQWNPAARITDGMLSIDLIVPPNSEIKTIVLKMAGAFNLAYQRFLDLQKAEAQAREAKIETALEKVRSRSMGMQRSDELQEVANILFLEVQSLGIPSWSCGYNILSPDKKVATNFMSNEGTIQKPFDLPLTHEPSLLEFYHFLQSEESFFTQELGGNALESHYNFMKSLPELAPVFNGLDEAGIALPTYQNNHLCKFTHGYLLFITYEPVPDAYDIFKRFTRVFEQTYTRFLDIKKSEAQARESQVELSLERIRSQVASMQESSDLFDIVVGMRTEFLALGHQADYFWHMRWLPDSYEMSMTSEDGSRIGMVITLPKFVHKEIPELDEWEKGDDPIFVLALDPDGAWSYIENMNTHGAYELADPNAPSRDDIEQIGGLTFIIARTTHGEIGFSLAGEVPEPPKESLETLVRFAGVFDLAYKRFEDLKAAELQSKLIREERDRLEIALKELRAAQEQLIQQEKLASLGQLTAGIAHEIKNPLNFVNNFSDVSIEMIDEALEELQQIGDNKHATETAAILADIQSNLTKIHEHGTRADGIVKSMLMHSRGGSGKMEPADLNALIKEYVNLSFHGMRAGKNPINVDIKLDLDDSFGKIALIEEDFSRVLLNLCNNAFDAMREKTKTDPSYKPLLSISTKQLEKTVEIAITDNGPGIPDNIKDKILQPFFTTKKGTEGTGLGLSITHDIVKAHGGELSINSKINAHTEFIIHLPV